MGRTRSGASGGGHPGTDASACFRVFDPVAVDLRGGYEKVYALRIVDHAHERRAALGRHQAAREVHP